MKEVRASLRRHWHVALLMLVLIPIAMGVYLANRSVERAPARYTTSADVLIPARDTTGSATGVASVDAPPVLLQGQEELVRAEETTGEAKERAELDPDLEGDVNLDGRLNEERTIMTLTVSAPNPEVASAVLEGYIVAYQNGRRQSVLDAAAELKEIQLRVINTLTSRLFEIESEARRLELPLPPRVLDGDPVDVPAGVSNESGLLLYERNAVLNEIQRRQVGYSLQATQATAPGTYTTVVQRRSTARITPPPPSPLIPLLEILAVGMLLAVAVPYALDRLDPTITEARAAPGALRAGLLQTIPYMPRRLHRRLAPPGSAWELAFRSLAATSISTDRLPKAIMVTSPDGSTQDAVAANFAAGLAGLGVSVALVGTIPRQSWFLRDADDDGERDETTSTAVPTATAAYGTQLVRVSTFPELLREAQDGGLTGDLRPRLGTRENANLFIVPPGEEETELSLDGLPPLLEALSRSGIDLVVIAGPALLDDANATIIAWSTRSVLWAIEIGQVNKSDAHLAADRLELAGVDPFGIALVNRSTLRT